MKRRILYFLILLTICFSAIASINNLKENISLFNLNSSDIKITQLLQEKNNGQFVAELAKGSVINEGGVLTKDGYIVEDTQTSNRDQHRLKRPLRNLNAENPLFFNGRLAVISSPGSENWYHWLLQILPRLKILAASKVSYDRIYINNLKFPWQEKALKEILTNLNISEEKLLIVNNDCTIQANVLIVPSVPFIPSKGTPLPNWLKSYLKEVFLKNTTESNEYEKVYISRSKASIRRMINENELTAKLVSEGFKVVHLEDFSPKQQAEIFYQAKVIVGVHGSGFANLIFSRPRTKIVEIDHGVTPPRSFYKKMTHMIQGYYIPYDADETTEEHLEDDILLSVPEFMTFLKQHI